MCRFVESKSLDQKCDEDNEDLPKVLIAIMTIKQRADFALEDIYNINEIMRKTKYILSNIVIIHRNIKENSLIAIKRIDRLSEHLETYEKIVSQIDYTIDIKAELKTFLDQIIDIKNLNDEFDEQWLKSEILIKENFDKFNQSFDQIIGYKKSAEDFITKRDYLKVTDLSILCKSDYKTCKDLDQTCNQWCKQSGDHCSDICDRVNQLENTFNQILRQSLDSMESARKRKQTAEEEHEITD